MTTTAIILNLAMSLPAVVVLIAVTLLVLRTGPDSPPEGRADGRGPFGRHLAGRVIQRTAASIATATNSSAR